MDRVDWRTWFSDNTRLETVLENIEREFPQKEYALERLLERFASLAGERHDRESEAGTSVRPLWS